MVEQRFQSPERQETSKSEFVLKLEKLWEKGNFVCLGLDTDYIQIPQTLKSRYSFDSQQMFEFNRENIDATHDLLCAVKPNIAFYEARGEEGFPVVK